MVTTDAGVADRYLGQWRENFTVEKTLVFELEAKAAKEREMKEKEAKEKGRSKAEGEAMAAKEAVVAEKKVATDSFDELNELDEEKP